MEKQKKYQETDLEIEVQQCSHMILNLENLKKPFWINLVGLGVSDAPKIEMGRIRLRSEENVICELTKKPCVLYDSGYGTNFSPHIDYHYLERCPSSEGSTKKYKLRGKKNGSLFYMTEIERIKEEIMHKGKNRKYTTDLNVLLTKKKTNGGY